MNLGKGLGFGAVGALVGAVVWIALIKATGWNLWILAPVVGGVAGYGMMRATQMKGGAPAGALAAAVTIAAIFGARYYIVTQDVDARSAVTEEEALDHLTNEVAQEMDKRGIPTMDENGEYRPRVRKKAEEAWSQFVDFEREQYIAGLRQQNREALGVLTPLGLLFDFGIFGTICTALAAGTAFKTGGAKLERELVERGMATEDTVADVASKMRAGETVSSSGGWRLPEQRAEERPLPRIKLVTLEEGAKPEDGSAEEPKREVA